MRLSVVVTVYNQVKYISEALQSVLAQTRVADEIVVVDGASDDGTSDILQALGNTISYLRLDENRGALLNSLAGVKASTGDVICMLDGDDVWSRNKLQIVERAFSEDAALMLLSHHHVRVDAQLVELQVIDTTHRNIARLRQSKSPSDGYREAILQQRGYWLGSAYCFRRSCFDVRAFERIIDGFEELRLTYLDLVIAPFLVLTNPSAHVDYTAETTLKYRVHSAGSMAAKDSLAAVIAAVSRGRATNALITRVMKTCHASADDLERRDALTAYYDFLIALYSGHRRLASSLFTRLARWWSWRELAKETARYAFVSTFGFSLFRRLLAKR